MQSLESPKICMLRIPFSWAILKRVGSVVISSQIIIDGPKSVTLPINMKTQSF